jgi:hypothetical protein
MMPGQWSKTHMTYSRELHGLDLYDEYQVAPGIFAAVDAQGHARLHNGSIFVGYTTPWRRRDRSPGWLVKAWSADKDDLRRRFHRSGYRTAAGAARAMVRRGVALNS